MIAIRPNAIIGRITLVLIACYQDGKRVSTSITKFLLKPTLIRGFNSIDLISLESIENKILLNYKASLSVVWFFK